MQDHLYIGSHNTIYRQGIPLPTGYLYYLEIDQIHLSIEAQCVSLSFLKLKSGLGIRHGVSFLIKNDIAIAVHFKFVRVLSKN